MAIKRQTHLYEVLIRLGPEGYRGAHVIDLEQVIDGQEVLAEKELPAREITEAEVGKLIGAKAAQLIEAADKARAQAAEMDAAAKEALAATEQARAEADARIADADARAAAAEAAAAERIARAEAEAAQLVAAAEAEAKAAIDRAVEAQSTVANALADLHARIVPA